MQRKDEVKLGGAAMSLAADLSCLQGVGGAADHEAALSTLEKQLICPICLELFSKPVVILPCQHNLCRKCANELYQPSLFQARTTMMVNSGRFRCPSCRHEVVLDRHGVYGLQRNLLVENIIDVYKQEVSNNNNNASSPAPLLPPPQLTCSDHEGEKVNIFCLTCQVPTCSLCKVFGAHQTCQVAPLTDVYEQQKDKLSEGVSSLVTFNNKVQALIDDLEETCRAIEENCKTQKQSVSDKFSRMVSILEERQKVMTQRISSEEEEKMGHTQTLVNSYGDSVEANTKLLERAASSMEEPDMAAFVQNSRELITKVAAATTTGPTETLTPGYENMSHYRFNFSKQERALKSIDFIKVVEDVPVEEPEPEVEAEPDEPKESSVQNTEPNHHQRTTTQNLDSVIKETNPVLLTPPVEPEPTAASTPSPSPRLRPPAPQLSRESVETTNDDVDSNEDEPDWIESKNVVEKDEATKESMKHTNICERQEGMNTQQLEVRETGSDAGDSTETQDDGEGVQINEGFYPSWYKPDNRHKINHDQMTCSTQPVKDSLSESNLHDLHVQSSPLTWSQDSQLLSETQTQIQEQDESFLNQPPFNDLRPQQQQQHLPLSAQLHAQPYFPLPLHEPQSELDRVPLADNAGIIEEENEEEEMQGWVCLPDPVEKHFGVVEGSFDLGDAGEDHFSDDNDAKSPEQTGSGLGTLSGAEVEVSEEKEQLEEDVLDFNVDSELREKQLGDGRSDAEMMEEGSELLKEAEDISEAVNDGVGGVEATGSSTDEHRDVEFEDGSSNKQDDRENVSVGEDEENLTPRVSLQAVTLLFYVFALLVILQRVWAYIGCFICT